MDRLTKAIDSMELDVEEKKKNHESRMDSAKKQYRHATETLKKITYKLVANHEYRYEIRLYVQCSTYVEHDVYQYPMMLVE